MKKKRYRRKTIFFKEKKQVSHSGHGSTRRVDWVISKFLTTGTGPFTGMADWIRVSREPRNFCSWRVMAGYSPYKPILFPA
jgi:hypothetical protein